MNFVFLNNAFLPAENALIHFRDLSFLRGYGVFDFFRLVYNTPLFLEEHLTRFLFSADQMRLPVRNSKENLKQIIVDLVEKNQQPNTGIRLGLSGGYSEDGVSIGEPVLVISQHSFPFPTSLQRTTGIKLMTFPHQRQLPQVKTIDYLMPIWLQPLVKQNGCDEILYYNDESITECPRSNVFVVTKEEKIITPASNILKGITRMKVLQKANQYFEVQERNVSLEELKEAKEVFITSTTKQILPVAQVDEFLFPERAVTERLQSLFHQYTSEH